MSAHLNETRLLAVDDNPDDRDVLSRRLKRLGYEHVLCVVDGEEALMMSAAAPFDAMLLDVMMPRKGGVEVRITVAGQARGGIVLGRHHPVHRVTGPIDHRLVRLALWPAGSKKYCLNHLLFPIIGQRLAVADEIHRAVTFTAASLPARRANASLTGRANTAGMNALKPTPLASIVAGPHATSARGGPRLPRRRCSAMPGRRVP